MLFVFDPSRLPVDVLSPTFLTWNYLCQCQQLRGHICNASGMFYLILCGTTVLEHSKNVDILSPGPSPELGLLVNRLSYQSLTSRLPISRSRLPLCLVYGSYRSINVSLPFQHVSARMRVTRVWRYSLTILKALGYIPSNSWQGPWLSVQYCTWPSKIEQREHCRRRR
jgi:hypothetical protein